MVMSDIRNSPQFIRGRYAEHIVAGWLQSRGWHIIPSYDFSGEEGQKSPKLQGLTSGYAIPDLDACRSGKRYFVEVKAKATAPFYRIKGIHTHGISSRLYEDYKKVEQITGSEVWLIIYEEDTGCLLGSRLKLLGKPIAYNGWKMGRDGMVFWPRENFKLITRFPGLANLDKSPPIGLERAP